MGKYDIPAVMTYILSVTGNAKLNYVGHSMGTSMFWVAMITRPELNDKIENMFALAPVSSLAHMRSVIRHLAPFQSTIQVNLWLTMYLSSKISCSVLRRIKLKLFFFDF